MKPVKPRSGWRIATGLIFDALSGRLGVSLMAINNWVNAKKIGHVKLGFRKSAIPLSEIKRVRAILAKEKRLR